MVKVKESDNEEVWKGRSTNKVDYLGSVLRLINYLIGITCFNFF